MRIENSAQNPTTNEISCSLPPTTTSLYSVIFGALYDLLDQSLRNLFIVLKRVTIFSTRGRVTYHVS